MDAVKQEHEFVHPNYMGVWFWLLGLTALEVAALYLLGSKAAQVLVLVFLAVTKALLVAMYFMHLKFEKMVLIAAILYPLVLAGALTVLTMLSLY